MKKILKNRKHIPFILANVLLAGLIIYLLTQAFNSYAEWICAGVSVAEKGVSEYEISFCEKMGFYSPNSQNAKFSGYLIILAGLYALLSILCITIFYFLTKKLFRVLNKNTNSKNR